MTTLLDTPSAEPRRAMGALATFYAAGGRLGPDSDTGAHTAPDPMDESDKRARIDSGGDRWTWDALRATWCAPLLRDRVSLAAIAKDFETTLRFANEATT